MEPTIGDITSLIESQGREWQAHITATDTTLTELRKGLDSLYLKAGRPGINVFAAGSNSTPPEYFYDARTKRRVPVLTHGQSLAALEGKATHTASVGRLLRGIVLGGRADDAGELAEERKALAIAADPSGGYTVGGSLSSQWIDALRSQMVLSRAGCRTIPMDSGTLSIARVIDDPVISWHAENASLPNAAPTFGAVNLSSKTVVCLVRLSLELAQDSANIETILQSTIVSAMASAIDKAGLVGATVNEGITPAGIMNAAGRNSVTGVGAPKNWDFLSDAMYELLLDNVAQPDIGALIAHPSVWRTMCQIKSGITNDNTSLLAPAEVAILPKLWTTAAPLTAGTATGIVGNWRDLLFGVRQDINVRVISEAFMGSNLQVAVLAYARVDFASGRPQSFCTIEGITV